MYDEFDKYGPYASKKEGRLGLILKHKLTGKRSSVSYPKYLMECHLERYFTKEETVDHIDKNPLNNDLSNLQILSRSEHTSLDVKRLKSKIFSCPICKKEFEISGVKLHDAISNRRRGKSGPYCSRSCAGKYGAMRQNNKIDEIRVEEISPEYTTKKKLNSEIQDRRII